MDSHVGKSTHAEASKGRDGSSGSDGITAHTLLAEQVSLVGLADGVVGGRVADAGTSSVGNNGSVYGNDVGHGEEGRESGADLGGEEGAGAFAPLRIKVSAIIFHTLIMRFFFFFLQLGGSCVV